MNRCPITYKICGLAKYATKGLKLLSPRLTALRDFPYTAEKQRREAVIRAAKMSIQGIQPKLSVKLNVKDQIFEIVDRGGRYIIKPQHDIYPQLPENEALTMYLAGMAGIETPLHGLFYCVDGTLSYFIRRFDRVEHNGKLALEDFAQLTGLDRDSKYNCSMEKVALVLDRFCTFPALEKVKLLRRSLFNYLVGNEDMHLKNFSLINRDGKIEMSPAYDFLSTTTAFAALGKKPGEIEEIALPLKGKKRGLARTLWLDYFGGERLQLTSKILGSLLRQFSNTLPAWRAQIKISFLPDTQKEFYLRLLDTRCQVLAL